MVKPMPKLRIVFSARKFGRPGEDEKSETGLGSGSVGYFGSVRCVLCVWKLVMWSQDLTSSSWSVWSCGCEVTLFLENRNAAYLMRFSKVNRIVDKEAMSSTKRNYSSANLSPLCHMPGVPEVWVFAEDARTTPEFGKSCFTRRPVYILLHVALQKKKQRMPHKLFCWCPKPRTSKNYNQTGERYLMSRKGMECERLFDHGFTNITNDWKYCTMSLQNHEVSSFLLPTSQAATTLI